MTDLKPQPKVLVADDDPDDRLLIKEAFGERFPQSQLGFVHDGVQLMRVLNGEATRFDGRWSYACPDLIMLDLNMPLKDGREVLREIKSNPKLRAIPTVVMTTSANSDDVRYCYEIGANSYIVKPSSYLGLLDVVSSLMDYWATTVILPTKSGKS